MVVRQGLFLYEPDLASDRHTSSFHGEEVPQCTNMQNTILNTESELVKNLDRLINKLLSTFRADTT